MNKTGNIEGLKKAWAVQRARREKRERAALKKGVALPPKPPKLTPNGSRYWNLFQLEMPKTATRTERRIARECLDIMIQIARREIRGPDARLAYTAAVRLREEIRGATLGSTSVQTIHSDSALTIELSPLLTPPTLRDATRAQLPAGAPLPNDDLLSD